MLFAALEEDQKYPWNLKVSKENDGDMEPPLVHHKGDRGALSVWSQQPFLVWNGRNKRATFWRVSLLARSLSSVLLTTTHYTLILGVREGG